MSSQRWLHGRPADLLPVAGESAESSVSQTNRILELRHEERVTAEAVSRHPTVSALFRCSHVHRKRATSIGPVRVGGLDEFAHPWPPCTNSEKARKTGRNRRRPDSGTWFALFWHQGVRTHCITGSSRMPYSVWVGTPPSSPKPGHPVLRPAGHPWPRRPCRASARKWRRLQRRSRWTYDLEQSSPSLAPPALPGLRPEVRVFVRVAA